jgi:hypothetical protein
MAIEGPGAIPPPLPDDNEDLVWALTTASTMWDRGDRDEALRWLRRAVEHAAEAEQDDRALELGKLVAELSSSPRAAKQAASPPVAAPASEGTSPGRRARANNTGSHRAVREGNAASGRASSGTPRQPTGKHGLRAAPVDAAPPAAEPPRKGAVPPPSPARSAPPPPVPNASPPAKIAAPSPVKSVVPPPTGHGVVRPPTSPSKSVAPPPSPSPVKSVAPPPASPSRSVAATRPTPSAATPLEEQTDIMSLPPDEPASHPAMVPALRVFVRREGGVAQLMLARAGEAPPAGAVEAVLLATARETDLLALLGPRRE